MNSDDENEDKPVINEDELKDLIRRSKKEFPDIDNYIIYTYCVDYLLNQKGIYGDEKLAEQLYEKAQQKPEYGIRIQ